MKTTKKQIRSAAIQGMTVKAFVSGLAALQAALNNGKGLAS